MIEKEIRYKIDEQIKRNIINTSEQIEKPSICVDLCMGKYGFDSLDKLGYIIRLRHKNGKCIMESKKRLDENTWEETSVTLKNIKEGYDFLSNIGLKPYLYINRTREVRKIKEAKIFIDEIELLGIFVEFELEEGYCFEDIEYYLKNNKIENKPEKLYGDIFKDKIQDENFRRIFEIKLNEFLMNN